MAGAAAGCCGVERWPAGNHRRSANVPRGKICQMATARRFRLRQRSAAYLDGQTAQSRAEKAVCGLEVAGVVNVAVTSLSASACLCFHLKTREADRSGREGASTARNRA